MMRPLSCTTPSSSSTRVIRSGAVRLTAMTLSQRSAAMLASLLSRVMPALCTTTSTPPCSVRRWCAMRCGRVLGGDVEDEVVAVELAHQGLQLAGGLGDVDADDRGAVAVQHPGDLLADAAAGAGHEGDLALQRTAPVGDRLGGRRRRGRRCARPGRRRRPTWGRGGRRAWTRSRRRRPRSTWTSWTVPPRPISLPSERVKPSRARWATRSLPRDRLGRGAEHDDARAGLEAAHQRGEELLQRDQAGGVGDAGGVEDQRLVALALRRRPWSRRCPRPSRSGGEPGRQAAGAADQRRCRSRAGRPSRYRSSRVGAGQAEVLRRAACRSGEETKPW